MGKWNKINKIVSQLILRTDIPVFQLHSKTSPEHFLMSYLNGLAGLSPKLASTDPYPNPYIETLG
jgi:hypothetical protein